MKRKFNKIWILAVASLMTFTVSCNDPENSSTSSDDENEVVEAKLGRFFRTESHLDTIYTIRAKNMSSQEHIMITSLQGIVAQKNAAIYVIEDTDDEKWLDNIKTNEDISTFEIDNPWDLVLLFAPYLNNNQYVLFNYVGESGILYTDQSINYATTVAGVERYLMIPKTLEKKAKEFGLTLGEDVTTEKWNTQYVFETYKDKLNKTYLIHQGPLKTQLRDYAIAGKALCYYSDYDDGSSDETKANILSWAESNAPILGWTENEINFVSANSLMSKITVAADWAANLSFHSSLEQDFSIKQSKYQKEDVKAEQGKHYLAIVMSDGDNVQWMTNSFASSNLYYGSPYRGDFKMTWTTSPSLYDLAPNILSYLYDNSTVNNEFIAGPSGLGYINAAEYNKDAIKDYAAYTAGYLEATDIGVVNFLDNYIDEEAYDEFAKHDQVKGGLVSVGNYYLEGEGGVYWSNDKPFVTVRETLWRSDADTVHNKYYGYTERVAQRINQYSTDPTKIEGYTVLVAHAWSVGSMEYLSRFVEQLDDHVELVTASELIDLVSENVTHENVDTLDDITKADLNNNLCPISTEQYRLSDFNTLEALPERKFVFSSKDIADKWNYNCGGLEYDFAGWSDNKIKLDGSDLEDRIDAFPNSWMYAKFDLNDEDKYLQIKVNGGDNADTNYRVRILYEDNGKLVSEVLDSQDYDTDLNEYGYYLLGATSPSTFNYDITKFANKTVMISIEQDDSGEGSGEIVNVNKVCLVSNTDGISQLSYWNDAQLVDEWIGKGKVVYHNNDKEGICLENFGEPASISCKVVVPTDATTFVISARKFIRTGNKQDKNAKVVVKVNGKVINEINDIEENGYVSVTLNTHRTFIYDFSEYAGQVVTVEIVNIEGEHACFDKVYFTSL